MPRWKKRKFCKVSFVIFRPVLIDAVVAAQTTPGQDAMMEFLNFNEENDITLPERYLLATAFSTHPSYKLLNDLLVSSTVTVEVFGSFGIAKMSPYNHDS